MKKFLVDAAGVAITLPLMALYFAASLLAVYGLFDLAAKKLFLYFMLALAFPPYGFIQGSGLLVSIYYGQHLKFLAYLESLRLA